jgi:hypothetical protein
VSSNNVFLSHDRLRRWMRWAMSTFYCVAGSQSFTCERRTHFFRLYLGADAPRGRPVHRRLRNSRCVRAVDALASMVGGVMLALYAVCVFPANIKHAIDSVQLPQLPTSWWYHAPRLALQPVLV